VGEHRRATHEGPGGTAAATGRAAHGQAREEGDGSASRQAGQAGVCPVAFCPICTAVSVVDRANPDVVRHLLLAGQQFLMALKAVVDARAADFDEPEAAETPLQRIDIG
jgi:hypothetical protein